MAAVFPAPAGAASLEGTMPRCRQRPAAWFFRAMYRGGAPRRLAGMAAGHLRPPPPAHLLTKETS